MRTQQRVWIWMLLLIASLALVPAGRAATQDTLRRFALVVGSNSGGGDRVQLRYAESDAREFIHLLQKIGGIFPIDSQLLIQPDRQGFLNTLQEFQGLVREARKHAKKVEFIFYYSGHSDEEALLLGGQRLYYSEVKKAIEQTPADVRIAILDSCASGAFTRLKGGKARPPFLVDSSYDMQGYAFMTSSSADEASQESDRLKGSFFTRALVSGLRGAADMTQDGRITVNEAYQFAYNETLARTEKTLSGPQHPNYNIQMSGTGDVVMTDIRSSSALLHLDPALRGRLFIRDAGGQLVVELRKSAGRPIQLGLEEGEYSVTNEYEHRVFTANVALKTGQQVTLASGQFTETAQEVTWARGDSGTSEADEDQAMPRVDVKMPTEGCRIKAWGFQLIPREEEKVIHEHLFHVVGGSSTYLDGWSLGLGVGMVAESTRGFQIAMIGNLTEKFLEGGQVSGIFNYLGGSMDGIQVASCLNYVNANLKGIQVGDGLNYVGQQFDGVQVGGGLNVVGQNAKGVQVGGVFNYTGQNQEGVQAAGVFNYIGQYKEGVQAAGVFNHAGEAGKGVQAAGVFNYTGKSLDGVQAAGVFNFAGEAGKGMQAAGVFNYAGKSLDGMQAAGVFCFAGGNLKGLQASGVFNYTDQQVEGFQVAGVCNVAGNGPRLTQAGMVNIAGDCDGLQVGLINVAGQQQGEAIGLISVAKNGAVSLDCWGDNLTGFNTAVKFRVNHLYSMLGVGKREWFSGSDEPFSCHLHFGGRIPLGQFYLEPDLGFVLLREARQDAPEFFQHQALQARVLVGCNLLEPLSIFLGAGANYKHDLTTHPRFNQGLFSPLYLGGVQVNL